MGFRQFPAEAVRAGGQDRQGLRPWKAINRAYRALRNRRRTGGLLPWQRNPVGRVVGEASALAERQDTRFPARGWPRKLFGSKPAEDVGGWMGYEDLIFACRSAASEAPRDQQRTDRGRFSQPNPMLPKKNHCPLDFSLRARNSTVAWSAASHDP
jgi:hypothetical protein